MLTLARHEPGVESTPLVPVRLDLIVREVVTDCAAFAVSRHIDLELDNTVDAAIQGDADSLRILVRNLVDNAIRYTPAGGVVSIRVAATRNAVDFTVSDTGPGIALEHRARIFDRFYRVGSSAEPGSGLGLAIVKAITEHHHAQIVLETPDRGGLRVRVRFALSASIA
jgi:two-component system OmpR family sensor kinase